MSQRGRQDLLNHEDFWILSRRTWKGGILERTSRSGLHIYLFSLITVWSIDLEEVASEMGSEAGCDTEGPVQEVVMVTQGNGDDEMFLTKEVEDGLGLSGPGAGGEKQVLRW